jgi:predicted DCC family thiol-disulfide oxidoreductase YuxK
MANIPQHPFTIYFDGACGLCRTEMMDLKAKDTSNRFELVDIAAPGFDAPAHGLDARLVKRFLHMKDANGKLLVGVDAFGIIWQFTGHPILAFLCRWPVSKPFAKLGYRLFAKYRQAISSRLCPQGQCSWERV